MTEKEKMIRGELYNAGLGTELYIERQNCKEMCHKHNNLSPKKTEERQNILKKILGKVGNSSYIEQPFMCDYGYNIEIGNNFYANHNLLILDPAKVIFGDNVFIGPNCSFYTALHPLDAKTRITGIEWAEPIMVGNNVWFGGGVTVLPNVKIGDNAVIGAGSVVTKDIPPNCVAVGNPCKVIKKLEN